MSRHSLLVAVALAASASVPAFAQVATPPAVDCAQPRGVDQRRACEAAREGTTELRRFALMTRTIYQVRPERYARTALEADRAKGLATAEPAGHEQVAAAPR